MSNTQRNIALAISGAILFLLLLFFAGRFVLNRMEIARERATKTRYGVPLLKGPIEPGGPTFGTGDRADIETLDNGWEWYGPRNDPKTVKAIFITIRNKSDHAYKNLEGEVAVYDRRGRYLRTEPCPFGPVAASETTKKSFGPVESGIAVFRLLGFKGQSE